MKNKKPYLEPVMEIETLDPSDVIVTSGDGRASHPSGMETQRALYADSDWKDLDKPL